jgi:23S rRNA pseudouridine2605 synthase
MALERLQKIMAAAGVASRRKSEEMILAGRVSVNGTTVTALGDKADPEKDHIRVDGKLLSGAEHKVYLLLHKPKGVVSTVTDPEGRPTVMDLVRNAGTRLYPVGRLDYMSEGLLLLTNDGELAEQLTRAASHVPKTYMVKVSGQPAPEAIERLRRGILLPAEKRFETGKPQRSVMTAPAEISLARDAENPWYEVTLTEGKNRQIRRMFKQVGHDVEKIRRVRYGPLELDVAPGEYRRLTPREVELLTRSPRSAPERPRAAAPEDEAAPERRPHVRPAQPGRKFRDERPAQPGRSSRSARPVKPGRNFRRERPAKPEGGFRGDRPARPGRDFRRERPAKPGGEFRHERPERPVREPRGERPEKPERRGFSRKGQGPERRSGAKRERPFARSERKQPFARPEGERPPQSGARAFGGRREKPEGGERRERRFARPAGERPERGAGKRPGGRPFRPGSPSGRPAKSFSQRRPGSSRPPRGPKRGPRRPR